MRRIRSDVCRAIIVTSIVWLMLDVIVLFFFLDTSLLVSERQTLARSSRYIANNNQSWHDTKEPTTKELELILAGLRFDDEGPGQNGGGVTIDKEKEAEQKEMFKQNQFNLMASNMISVNRHLPDYRSAKCKSFSSTYNINELPPVSIIIVFHNEAFSTLLRTLHSVINRSSHSILKEIILVDDKSERGKLGNK